MNTRFFSALLALPRPGKRIIAVSVDVALSGLSLWFAMSLLQEQWLWPDTGYYRALGGSLLICLPIFIRFGLYRAIFRFTGANALVRVALAMALYGVCYALIFTVVGVQGVPRAVGVLQPLMLLVAVMGSRSLVRYWLGNHSLEKLSADDKPRVVIYGAGSAGRQLAAGLGRASHEQTLVAFLDDDAALRGHSMDGRQIYHPDDLAELITTEQVTDVLLAIPSVNRQRRNEILTQLRAYPVHVRTLPGLSDLAAGRVDLDDVRELDVEDLLGRDTIAPDVALMGRLVRERVVMVTGAGGSIGSELCRQILRCRPAKLLLFELSEFALYQIHRELESVIASDSSYTTELVPLLGSVQDEARLREIIGTWRPNTIYHAAAYKHVPLVEHNPAEGVKNNVWGTWTCARVAAEAGVSNFVLISTDKAVRPTNIMGASKRLAEMVLQALASERHHGTVFAMVRFGNVLGSSGSVVPLFRDQIRRGGPITLTHRDITRFFMTIPEAAQLVLQAGAMSGGGDVFVLDMGSPVRIIDLARRMVELSGQTVRDEACPHGDIEIQITGLRPGEKLYEELLIGDNPQGTEHPRIMKAHEDFLPWPELQHRLAQASEAIVQNDVARLRDLLAGMVPGYKPSGEVVDWVSLEQTRGDRSRDELGEP